jgi:hypothetical protein
MLSEQEIVRLAARVLEQRGHTLTEGAGSLAHPASRFLFLPHLSEQHPLEAGGFHTVSMIVTIHPELAPDGIFEYQHGTGA